MERKDRLSGKGWVREYVLGLGVGTAAALYGIVAMVMGRTFLPSLHGTSHMVKNLSGLALAAAYLLGGLYLLLRLFLEKRMAPDLARRRLYVLENVILVGLIGALVYVLLHVGEVA